MLIMRTRKGVRVPFYILGNNGYSGFNVDDILLRSSNTRDSNNHFVLATWLSVEVNRISSVAGNNVGNDSGSITVSEYLYGSAIILGELKFVVLEADTLYQRSRRVNYIVSLITCCRQRAACR